MTPLDDERRRRIIDSHRIEKRKQIASLRETVRQLKLDVRAFVSSESTAINALMARVAVAEMALDAMMREHRQDETTIRLPTLPDPEIR